MTKKLFLLGLIATSIVATGLINAATEFTEESECQTYLRDGAKLSDGGYNGFVAGACCKNGNLVPTGGKVSREYAILLEHEGDLTKHAGDNLTCSPYNYCRFACIGRNHLADPSKKSKADCLQCCEQYSKTKSRSCPEEETPAPAPEDIKDKETCTRYGYFWEFLTKKCKKG